MKNILFLLRLCASMKTDTDLLTTIKSSEFFWENNEIQPNTKQQFVDL